MTTSDEDQNEEVARAMYGEALPGRDWMRCPDHVRQHWRRYARVALDAAFAALTTPQEAKAHDHSVEPMLWCETHQREHIAGIPRFTYQCKDCGWGQWYRDQAREHESATAVSFHHRHETYEVEHVLRLIAPPAPQDGDARIEMSMSSVVAYHEWRKALGSERLSDDEGTAARIAFYAGWDHALARATVPDAAQTLCVECNEVEVLGKPEHRVLCMDCAYETGRAAVPDAATETERDAALAAIERVRAEADAYAEQPDVMELCGAVAQALRTALDGAPEPEWEYQCTNRFSTTGLVGDPELHARQCSGKIERRRKAGPWEACNE